MDRLADLDLFARVARRASLAGAAQELGLTGAAVSKRLAALEQRLGVRLVQRTTRRLRITPEGERYLAEGAELLAALDALEHGLRDSVAAPSGLLRVNASFGFGRRVLAGLAAEFAQQQPRIEVQLHLSERPLNLIEEGFDVGIRIGDSNEDGLTSRLLMRNRRIVCAAPAYLARHGEPQQLADLARHRAIVLRENDEAHGVWRLHRGDRIEAVKVVGTMATNDGQVAVAWALAGLGLLLRSEWDIAPALADGRLRTVLPDWCMPADAHAVYPTRRHLPAKTRAFIDFIASRLQSHRSLPAAP